MRSLSLIFPLAFAVPLLPAQEQPGCDHDSPCDQCSTPNPPCTAPAFAPLPADPTLAPQWQSLDLPATDPTASQKPFPGAPPSIDSIFDHPVFNTDPSVRPRAVMDPFAEMQRQMQQMQQFQEQMHRQMQQQLQLSPGVQIHGFTSQASGLEDRGDHYSVDMEIQGLNCSTPRLTLNGNMLTLECRQTQEVTETTPDGDTRCSARYTNNIRQSWTLPADADREAIDAKVDGEHLTITIAKSDSTVDVPLTTWNE